MVAWRPKGGGKSRTREAGHLHGLSASLCHARSGIPLWMPGVWLQEPAVADSRGSGGIGAAVQAVREKGI